MCGYVVSYAFLCDCAKSRMLEQKHLALNIIFRSLVFPPCAYNKEIDLIYNNYEINYNMQFPENYAPYD